MNRTIHRVCKMLDAGKTLAEVRQFLEPLAHCANLDCLSSPVVREAWHAALAKARNPKPVPKPIPQRAGREGPIPHKAYRAERRNAERSSLAPYLKAFREAHAMSRPGYDRYVHRLRTEQSRAAE